MHVSILVSALFSACVLTAPVPEAAVVTRVVVQTVVVTAGSAAPTQAPTKPLEINAPAPAPIVAAAAADPAPEAKPASPAPPAEAIDSEVSSSSSNDGSPHSPPSDPTAETILASINKWRSKYNKQLLTWDNSLADLAQSLARKNGGERLVHTPASELHFAQIIGPGMQEKEGETLGMSPFEFAMVNGWLCEVSSDPQLEGICAKTLKVGRMAFGGQTGHHDILVDNDLKTVGCGFSRKPGGEGIWSGQWVCNLQSPGMA